MTKSVQGKQLSHVMEHSCKGISVGNTVNYWVSPGKNKLCCFHTLRMKKHKLLIHRIHNSIKNMLSEQSLRVSPGKSMEYWVNLGNTVDDQVLQARKRVTYQVSPGERIEHQVSPGERVEHWVNPGNIVNAWVNPGKRPHDQSVRENSGVLNHSRE